SGSRKAKDSGSRKAKDSGSRKGARSSGARKGVNDSASRKGARSSGSRKAASDSGSRKGARSSGSRKAASDSGRGRRSAPPAKAAPTLWIVLALVGAVLVAGGGYLVGRGAADPEPEVSQVEPTPGAEAGTPAVEVEAPEVDAPAAAVDAPQEPADEEPAPEEAPQEPQDLEPASAAIEQTARAPIKGPTDTGKVTRVVDGDTFHMADGRKVRLIGINTPERKSNDPLNEEATQLLRDLVDGKTVTLEYDTDRTDQFKRTLAHVFVGDLYVNGEIVRQGLAYCYTWAPNTAHEKDLSPYQQQAREQKRGLWGLEPPAPADYYEASRSAHRFHRPGCSKGPRGNARRFMDRNEAFDEGLNPCSDCKP
ncbi:MAG: thermonuclease family protein, partial [Planctomycetota bacterium]